MGHIKLWDNMLDCPKIHRLSDKAYRCWTKLLLTALRNGGRNGELPLLETLVFRMRMSAEDIKASIEEMHRCCLVEPCPDNPIGGMPWRIHDWDDWQRPKDPGAAERQARWRDKQALRNAQHNGHVTHNETPVSIEALKEEELNPPLKPPKGAKPKFVLPSWVPSRQFNDYVEMRRKNRKHMTDRAKELLVIKLERFQGEGQDILALLELATERCWQTVIVPDEKPFFGKASGKPAPTPSDPMADPRPPAQIEADEANYQRIIAARKAKQNGTT